MRLGRVYFPLILAPLMTKEGSNQDEDLIAISDTTVNIGVIGNLITTIVIGVWLFFPDVGIHTWPSGQGAFCGALSLFVIVPSIPCILNENNLKVRIIGFAGIFNFIFGLIAYIDWLWGFGNFVKAICYFFIIMLIICIFLMLGAGANGVSNGDDGESFLSKQTKLANMRMHGIRKCSKCGHRSDKSLYCPICNGRMLG